MGELLEFLTSKEIVVVYIVALVACLLCFIIYLIDKTYDKRKQRQNTKELNKLVEEVSSYVDLDAEDSNVNVEPVIDSVEEVSSYKAVRAEEVKEDVIEVKQEENSVEELELIQEEVKISTDEVSEPVENIVLESINEVVEPVVEEKLQYTTIEPDEVTAKLELKKLAEELEKAEEVTNNIELTSYEEEQESNAIISLEELVKKSKEMYEANELSQYADEGNEPISLADLEKKMNETSEVSVNNLEYTQPFIIEDVVDEITTEDITELLDVEPVIENVTQVSLDDFNTVKVNDVKTEVKPVYQTSKKFQSSPIISPIYGIERKISDESAIELENTANYEKLDEEIKKTNEFLMTLKELQKHLD